MGAIYVITCVPTGQQYVGLTSRTGAYRISQHWYDSQKPKRREAKKSKLLDEMSVRCREDFVVEDVFFSECQIELALREIDEITQRNTIENGLNTSVGGPGKGKQWRPT